MNSEINTILAHPDKFSKGMVSKARNISEEVLNYFEIFSSQIKSPFAEDEASKKNIKSYADELKALEKQFAETPDLSLVDKFKVIERKDTDNLSKGREKAKLLKTEIKGLNGRMKNLRSVTDDALKLSPELQKATLEVGKKGLEEFRKLPKERFRREQELADLRLSNEKIIADRRKNALDDYSKTIKNLEADVSKYQKESSANSLWQMSAKGSKNLVTGYTKKGEDGKNVQVSPVQARRESALNSLRKNLIDSYLQKQTKASGYEKSLKVISDKFSPEKASRFQKALFEGSDKFFQIQIDKLQNQSIRKNRFGETVFESQEAIAKLEAERAELYETLSTILNETQLKRLKKFGAIGMVSSLKSNQEREYAQGRLEQYGLKTPFEKWQVLPIVLKKLFGNSMLLYQPGTALISQVLTRATNPDHSEIVTGLTIFRNLKNIIFRIRSRIFRAQQTVQSTNLVEYI